MPMRLAAVPTMRTVRANRLKVSEIALFADLKGDAE